MVNNNFLKKFKSILNIQIWNKMNKNNQLTFKINYAIQIYFGDNIAMISTE